MRTTGTLGGRGYCRCRPAPSSSPPPPDGVLRRRGRCAAGAWLLISPLSSWNAGVGPAGAGRASLTASIGARRSASTLRRRRPRGPGHVCPARRWGGDAASSSRASRTACATHPHGPRTSRPWTPPVLDRDACRLAASSSRRGAPSEQSPPSGAVLDLRSDGHRPAGWSADAAGLPILPARATDAGDWLGHALDSVVDRFSIWTRHAAGLVARPCRPWATSSASMRGPALRRASARRGRLRWDHVGTVTSPNGLALVRLGGPDRCRRRP